MHAPESLPSNRTPLRPWLAAALLLAGCLFIYQDVLSHGFAMFDDDINFLFNRDFGPLSWDRLRWIATEHSVMLRYVPIGWLAYCGIATFGGMDPFWFHLVAVILHASSAIVLYFILLRVARRLTPETALTAAQPAGPLLAVALAAAWAWHPLRVETVAWITALIYLWGTWLGLLSLLAFVTSLDHPRPAVLRVVSIGLFVAALFAHPAAIAFLPLLAACAVAWRFTERPGTTNRPRSHARDLALLLAPFAAAATLCLGVTLAVRQLGSVVTQASTPSLAEFGLAQRVAQAGAVFIHFILKTLWPAKLSPAYPLLEQVDPAAPLFLLSILATATIVLLAFFLCRRRQLPGLFAVAALAATAPFLGLQEHPFYPSDRYTHIPSLGLVLFLLVAVSSSRLAGRRSSNGFMAMIACVLLPLWAGLSIWQVRVWSSDDALFHRIASIQTQASSRVFFETRLLRIHLNRGEIAAARVQLEAWRAAASAPTFAALEQEVTQAANDPLPPITARLLVMQSHYAAEQGDLDGAIERLQRALAIAPRFTQARLTVALFQASRGDSRGALAQLMWLRLDRAEIPAASLRVLQAAVAGAFRTAGEVHLAREVEDLP